MRLDLSVVVVLILFITVWASAADVLGSCQHSRERRVPVARIWNLRTTSGAGRLQRFQVVVLPRPAGPSSTIRRLWISAAYM